MSGNNHVNAHQDHGSAKQYVVGFIISIILTVIPFFMVMNGGKKKGKTDAVMGNTMIAQVRVQLVWFVHMKRKKKKKWQVLAFWYTCVTIAILFIGSVWILSELHTFMM